MSVGAVDAVTPAPPPVAAPAPVAPAPAALPPGVDAVPSPTAPLAPPATVDPAHPANWDPTGTVPVAGSPADPLHPVQQAAAGGAVPAAPVPAPVAPTTPEDAAQRRYAADQEVAKVDDKLAATAADAAKTDETRRAKESEVVKAQAAELAAEEARHREGLAKADAERNALQQSVKDFKFHNFWDDKTVGQKILAGIGIILGSASYSKEHVNAAAQSIDTAVEQEWRQQKAELDRRTDAALKSGENARELRLQYDYESGQLKLRQETQLHALANEMDALAARSKNQAGVLAAQKVAAEARALAEQHGQQGVQDIAKAHSEALKDAETQSQIALNNAKAGKLKPHGGGGGNDAAFAAFVDAAGKLKPGDPIPPDVARLAHKAGFKLPQIADAVAKYRSSGAKATEEANKAAGVKPGAAAGGLDKNAVVYGGRPIGLAPSGRGGAAGFTKGLIAYDDSLKSLEALKQYVQANPVIGAFPRGDAYNRAVLAIAATTTANPSDSTTKHEADTLKGLFRVSPQAIQTSIDHIRERREALLGTLLPLPASGGAFQNAPPPASTGGPVEGSRSISAKGVQIIFRNGKWGPV